MNYADKRDCIIPEVSDIGNKDAYDHFSRVLVRKDVYVYYVRDIIEKYLKTDTANSYVITNYVQYACRYMQKEIDSYDETSKLYPKFDLHKFSSLLLDYTESYQTRQD
jgi:hypothetical protein